MIKYNPSVYVAIVDGGMAGMVTRKAVKRGDILCAYEGVRLSEKGARTSTSEYNCISYA